MIQETIWFAGQLHPECFNLSVRKLARAEVERTAGTNLFGRKHYFDLQFHAQSRALRHSWMQQGQRTTTLLDSAVVQPFPKYNVFNSTIYLLPLSPLDSSYGLLVVNMMRRVVVMDPAVDIRRVEENTHTKEMRKEITLLKQEFNNVLQARIPG